MDRLFGLPQPPPSPPTNSPRFEMILNQKRRPIARYTWGETTDKKPEGGGLPHCRDRAPAFLSTRPSSRVLVFSSLPVSVPSRRSPIQKQIGTGEHCSTQQHAASRGSIGAGETWQTLHPNPGEWTAQGGREGRKRRGHKNGTQAGEMREICRASVQHRLAKRRKYKVCTASPWANCVVFVPPPRSVSLSVSFLLSPSIPTRF